MNKEDIIMNAVFFGVLTLSVLLSIHMVNNDIEIDTTPLYWPETFPPDPEPDWEDSDEWHEMWYNKLDTNSNGEVDTEEYHGKEGKSEYGEYEYNEWMEMQ
jgi:hypothetical protein